ncbi:zinc-binding dehydrogenase [Simkania sp.]|uniref:zinc-binding dehydrogenase n=1 Tax=Simkania sp. TaxID=34094 RepID=UPI003B52A1A8
MKVSSLEKANFCKELGADFVINYIEQDFVEQCLGFTQGQGVDVVIETTAADNFVKDCMALRKSGRLVLIGAGTRKSSEGVINFHHVYANNIEIQGMSLFNVGDRFSQLVNHVQRLLQRKKIRPFVFKSFPLTHASQSHEVLLSEEVPAR